MNIENFTLLMTDDSKVVSDTIFTDLCLINFFCPENEDEFKAFLDVLKHPSVNIDVLNERQHIFEDFNNYPLLIKDMVKCCEEAEFYKIQLKTTIYRSLPPIKKLQIYIENVIPLIKITEQFNMLFRNKQFKSQTLSSVKVDTYDDLIEEIKELYNIESTDSVKLNVSFTSGFKLKDAVVVDTKKNKIKPKLNRQKNIIDTDIVSYGLTMSQYIVKDILSATIVHMCSLVSQIHSSLLNFYKHLKRDLTFYIAALHIMKYMDDKKLPYCIPEINDDLKTGIDAKGLYNITVSSPVTNDFDCSLDNHTAFITGLNQGGKTTILRAIGIAQLMAQAGLFVPAISYKCTCFKGIITHFPADEDKSMNFGKLAEELYRLHNDFPLALGGGLVLLNESFATTTSREGSLLAIDLLNALSETDSTVVFVTHLTELPLQYRALSYITEYKPNNMRTYKIIKGVPLKELNAVDLFNF